MGEAHPNDQNCYHAFLVVLLIVLKWQLRRRQYGRSRREEYEGNPSPAPRPVINNHYVSFLLNHRQVLNETSRCKSRTTFNQAFSPRRQADHRNGIRNNNTPLRPLLPWHRYLAAVRNVRTHFGPAAPAATADQIAIERLPHRRSVDRWRSSRSDDGQTACSHENPSRP